MSTDDARRASSDATAAVCIEAQGSRGACKDGDGCDACDAHSNNAYLARGARSNDVPPPKVDLDDLARLLQQQLRANDPHKHIRHCLRKAFEAGQASTRTDYPKAPTEKSGE